LQKSHIQGVWLTSGVKKVLPFTYIFLLLAVTPATVQWRAEGGGRTGRLPRAANAGGIQRVKLQKLKCCN